MSSYVSSFSGGSLLKLLVILCGVGATANCGAPPPAETQPSELHLRVLGTLYGHFMSQSAGRVPSKESEFIDFLEGNATKWETLASSAEELLAKTQEGHEVVVLFGKEVHADSESGFPWIAYSQGTDGKFLAANARGVVLQVDKQELVQLIPGSQ